MSGFSQVLKKNLNKEHLVCALQKGIDALNAGGPAAQTFNGELQGFIASDNSVLGGAAIFAHSGWDPVAYPYSGMTIGPVQNASCAGEGIGTLIINPNIPAGNSITTADFSFEILDNSAGLGGIVPFCITDGRLLGPQRTVPNGGLGTNTAPSNHTVTLTFTDTSCPSEDIRFAYTAWGQQGNAGENCDEINPDIETLVTVTPSKRDAARACFAQLFCDFNVEELSDFEEADVKACIATYIADNNVGGLTEAEIVELIGPHTDPTPLCPAQAIIVPPNITYLNPQIHRRGYRGEDTDAARCDHTHDRRRINPTPLRPDVTFAGTGTLDANLLLREWSDDTWVAYQWRVLVSQDAGTGWGYVIIPNLAGFQRPEIDVIGTYRIGSTAVQEDGSGNTNNQSTEGAGPRGPYMGQEAHHWSGTQRIYMGYFRRDNPHRTYVEIMGRYTCL